MKETTWFQGLILGRDERGRTWILNPNSQYLVDLYLELHWEILRDGEKINLFNGKCRIKWFLSNNISAFYKYRKCLFSYELFESYLSSGVFYFQ